MTDGANTLSLDMQTGKHVVARSKADLEKSYKDMQAICDYAQSQKIEVFTVSFMVDDDKGRKAMADCASGAGHAFDATDETELNQAFQNIAAALKKVILTR